MKTKQKTLAVAAVVTLFSLGLAGCGGGGGGGDGSNGRGDGGDLVFPNVQGLYSFDTNEISFGCTDGTQDTAPPISLNLVVTQNGNRIVLENPDFIGIPGAVVLDENPFTGNVQENSRFNVTSIAVVDFVAPIGRANVNYNVNGLFTDRGWNGDYRFTVSFLEINGVCDYRTTFSGTRLGDVPGNGDVEPIAPLGLDGTWGGIAEDIDYDMGTISATVEERSITRFSIDGVDQNQTSLIAPIESDVFSYRTSDGINGGMIVDPSKLYGVIVNEQWEFGVVQKGATAPYGSATIVDLNGSWSGFFVGLFDDEYYRFPVTSECNSNICVTTATGPAVNGQGVVVEEITGVQSTANFMHRASLAFDFTFANTLGGSGVGAGFLSKDKRFLGVYACPESMILGECEFGALVKN